MTGERRPIDRVYGASDNVELEAGYDAWAADYERDTLALGYRLPAVINGFVARYLAPGEGPILDAGVGTGFIGDSLAILGYRDLVGIDLSRGMLEVAGRKGVYRELHRMMLGEPLDFPDDSFRAVVSTGVFTRGHAPASALDELVRITRPGGHLLFSVRLEVYEGEGFKEKQEALETAGRWRLLESTAPIIAMPVGEPEVLTPVFVYEAL